MEDFMDICRISNGDNNYGALINAFSFSFSELLAEMAVCAEGATGQDLHPRQVRLREWGPGAMRLTGAEICGPQSHHSAFQQCGAS